MGHFTLTHVFSLMKACNCSKNTTFNEVKQGILLSGDLELNPGPKLKNLTHEQSALSPLTILETKFLLYGLIRVEMGGQRNCFLHVISHQLFNDPPHHLYIRAAGVNYLRQNPERFIESNLDRSWLDYLENVSKQETRADNLIIQGVADALNLKIITINDYKT